MAMPTPLFQTSRLQNCEIINFCFQPPSLGHIVITATGNKYTLCMLWHLTCLSFSVVNSATLSPSHSEKAQATQRGHMKVLHQAEVGLLMVSIDCQTHKWRHLEIILAPAIKLTTPSCWVLPTSHPYHTLSKFLIHRICTHNKKIICATKSCGGCLCKNSK